MDLALPLYEEALQRAPLTWAANMMIAGIYTIQPSTVLDAVYHYEWILANLNLIDKYGEPNAGLSAKLLACTWLGEMYCMRLGVCL